MVYGVGGADGVGGEPAVVLGAGVLLVPGADAGVEQAGAKVVGATESSDALLAAIETPVGAVGLEPRLAVGVVVRSLHYGTIAAHHSHDIALIVVDMVVDLAVVVDIAAVEVHPVYRCSMLHR